MAFAARRTHLVGTAALLLLGQAGCATHGVRAQPSPPPPIVSEDDRKACESLARTEAPRVEGKSVVGSAARGFAGGLIGGTRFLLFGGFILGPLAAIWDGVGTAWDNAKLRREAYGRAMEACLERARGPEPPDAAPRLDIRADRYTREDQYGRRLDDRAIADLVDDVRSRPY